MAVEPYRQIGSSLPLELDVLEQELRDNFFHLRLLPNLCQTTIWIPCWILLIKSSEARFVRTLKELERQSLLKMGG